MSAEDGSEERLGKGLATGARHYRAFVGPPEDYDLIGALQFSLLMTLGLREHHTLLDIGCGSLRAGRLFIPYLLPERYFAIEPERWLIDEGIRLEIGQDQIDLKKPTFSQESDFRLTCFGRSFDFLMAQSIFSHTSPAQIDRCLSEARKVMTETSVFVATFVEGAQNYDGEKWAYQGDNVTYTEDVERRGSVTYTLDFLQEAAVRAGLVCTRLEYPHPRQVWVAFTTPEGVDRLPAAEPEARIGYLEDQLTRLRRKQRPSLAERVVSKLERTLRRS